MMNNSPSAHPEIQTLLAASREGDKAARDALFEVVHRELSAIAAFLLRGEHQARTLATGDLVNEAVLRLLQTPEAVAEDKAHFLSIAARVMRQVLIDAARKRNADKRQVVAVTLTENCADGEEAVQFEFQALETALARLRMIDAQRADIVIMRYYGGMSIQEIALDLGVSESTVKRSWRAARAWLRDAIEQ